MAAKSAKPKKRSPGKVARGTAEVARQVRAGLPMSELFALKERLEVSNEALAPMVGLSLATLNRRRAGERLSPVHGDRVMRYLRLFDRACEVMGTAEHARAWLKAPQGSLGGSTPLDFALTEIGAREVEDLLGRIEHGVYT